MSAAQAQPALNAAATGRTDHVADSGQAHGEPLRGLGEAGRRPGLPPHLVLGLGPRQPFMPLMQFALFNLVCVALLAAAYLQGWVETVVRSDATGLSVVIGVVFLAGLAVCGCKVWTISRDEHCVANFDGTCESIATRYLREIAGRDAASRGITGEALRARMTARIAPVRHIAGSLVLLGLVGTVLGFIIALSGVEPQTVGDVRAIAPMVSNLIGGMSVALYTTLVGAVLNIWLMVDYQILAVGATRLVADLVALGEANARD